MKELLNKLWYSYLLNTILDIPNDLKITNIYKII